MISITLGVLLRVWNIVVLPHYYGLPLSAVMGMLPLIGVFNGIQGTITTFIGHMLYEAYTRNVSTRAHAHNL